jgi:shikimate kinase
MVTTLTDLQKKKEIGWYKSLIVEIIGPAGAGKTTLFHALEKFEPEIQAESLPPVWNLRYIPFFVKNTLLLTPTFARLSGKGDRILTRRELAWMAMLRGWPKILKKKAQGDHKVIILDQGPIFLMAILSEFGPKSLRSSNIQGYWGEIEEQWTHTLNMVICLDTSDDILMKRIRTRRDEHLVKDKTDQEIIDFLAKYRAAYDRLINSFVAHNRDIRILRMDTGKNSSEEIVNFVINEFKLCNNFGGVLS